MLLLYPDACLPAPIGYRIYIPLCFYFILACPQVGWHIAAIYIPLCFYFIPLCQRIACCSSYLHSTMLLLYREHPGKYPYCYQFTFHYASTLSISQALHGCNKLHLHSTMLLLYRFSLFSFTIFCFIYIPLCFYFIRRITGCGMPDIIIYIPLCFYFIKFHVFRKAEIIYLHSTMLLLYPKRRP